MIKSTVTAACLLAILTGSWATESRVETMGKRDVFFRDDMSIFRNPANVGVLGNFITGSLGFVNDLPDTQLVNTGHFKLYDTLTSLTDTTVRYVTEHDSLIYDTVVTPETKTPLNQWFGVSYNYPLNGGLSVFGGAAFNREDEQLLYYERARSQREASRGIYLPSLKGKTDLMLGARWEKMNVGVGLYHASQDVIFQDGVTKKEVGPSVSLTKFSVGTEVALGEHSLEAFGGMGTLSYSNKTAQDTSSFKIKPSSDGSLFAGARFFLHTKMGGGLTFVPAFNYSSFAMLDSTVSTVSGGLGINLRLDGGFFWAGVEGDLYSAENDSSNIEISGKAARFNFGIEKSLIWKWLLVRVGGSKYLAKETVKVGGMEATGWVENPVDNGLSEDFLGFGVGLNYQNRLRFDVTLNEALPYFNPFGNGLEQSTNGGHLLLRISSTFSL